MKVRLSFILVSLLCFQLSALETDKTDWFTFYLPWDDSSRNITNLSTLLDPPAGKHGFLQVASEGKFHFQNDPSRVKFTGVVNVANANYPDSNVAVAAAARMAKFGINLVRIHLIDVDGIYGLFQNSTANTIDLSAERLDRMDFFVNELKKKGIYVNFCIQSGRVYKDGDNVNYPVLNNQSKYVTLFNQRLIDLQKDYARKTLEHVNPYTGLAYKDDPAVAQVELTNENSLFLGWISWGGSAIFGDVENGIGPQYSAQLDSLFNEWLREKYGTDQAIAQAWAEAGISGQELITNQSFETGSQGWSYYVHAAAGADADITTDTTQFYHGKRSQKIAVNSPGTENWHIQFNTNTFSVQEGKSYCFSFFVKSDNQSPFQVELLKNVTWKWYGGEEYSAGLDWKRYDYYFAASETVVDSMRFNINFGRSTGTFWIDSASIKEVALTGRENDETIAAGNYRRMRLSEFGKYSSERVGDNARFYFELEGRYIGQLSSFLKDSVGIKVPVTFTNNYYGLASIYSQSRADYMDTHLYWDHPNFPNGWSSTNWNMKNSPMVKDPYGATINGLVLSKVKGKPLVLSEYNHPYPQPYQCEAPGILYAYSGFHDLDGVLWHAYIDYHDNYAQQYQKLFFDIGMNPIMMTQQLLSVPFRTGRIKTPSVVVNASYNERDIFNNTRIYKDQGIINIPGSKSSTSSLKNGFAHADFNASQSSVTTSEDPGKIITSSSGELFWDGSSGLFKIDNPYWNGAVGFMGRTSIQMKSLGLSQVKTTGSRDFAAIHLLSMDSLEISSSKRMLLLTSARMENKGLLWNSSGTGLLNQGGQYILCEPVNARVTLKGARDSMQVFSLDPRGERVESIPVSFSGDSGVFLISGKTLWYEISNSGIIVKNLQSAQGKSGVHLKLSMNRNFLRFQIPERGKLSAEMYTLDGRKQVTLIQSKLMDSGKHDIALPNRLPGGMYIMQIRYKEQSFTYKFMTTGR